MKLELLVADVTAVGSPDIAERDILEVLLAGRCFGQFRPYLFVVGGPLSPRMVVAEITVVRSPGIAECAIFEVIFG